MRRQKPKQTNKQNKKQPPPPARHKTVPELNITVKILKQQSVISGAGMKGNGPKSPKDDFMWREAKVRNFCYGGTLCNFPVLLV